VKCEAALRKYGGAEIFFYIFKLCGLCATICPRLALSLRGLRVMRGAWLVWSKCYEWVGLAAMVHQDPKMHFSQFRMNEESEEVNQIWYCVWIAL